MRVAAYDGQSLYEVANKHDIFIGNSYTCHVVLSPASFAAHDVATRPFCGPDHPDHPPLLRPRQPPTPSDSRGRDEQKRPSRPPTRAFPLRADSVLCCWFILPSTRLVFHQMASRCSSAEHQPRIQSLAIIQSHRRPPQTIRAAGEVGGGEGGCPEERRGVVKVAP